MSNEDIINILKTAWPLIIIQLSLQIYAIVDIAKKKKTRNLSVVAWVIIIIIGELLGPIAYLLFGKAGDQ